MATRIGQLETSDNIFHGYTDEYAEVFLDTHIYIYIDIDKDIDIDINIDIDIDILRYRWMTNIVVSAMASWEAHDQNEWLQFENMVILKQHPTKGGLLLGASSNYGEFLPCVTGEYQGSTHSA